MLGDVLNTQELLTLATSIEGHPDNVAPALLGGLTSSVFEDGVVYSVKRDVDESLCFAAIVPDYKLLTEGTIVSGCSVSRFSFYHRLDVPQVTILADLLRQSGIDVPVGVLHRQELVDAILRVAQIGE